MSVTLIVFDTVAEATKSKITFGNDYDMYCSFLSQFCCTTSGEDIRIIPLSQEKYMFIKEASEQTITYYYWANGDMFCEESMDGDIDQHVASGLNSDDFSIINVPLSHCDSEEMVYNYIKDHADKYSFQ